MGRAELAARAHQGHSRSRRVRLPRSRPETTACVAIQMRHRGGWGKTQATYPAHSSTYMRPPVRHEVQSCTTIVLEESHQWTACVQIIDCTCLVRPTSSSETLGSYQLSCLTYASSTCLPPLFVHRVPSPPGRSFVLSFPYPARSAFSHLPRLNAPATDRRRAAGDARDMSMPIATIMWPHHEDWHDEIAISTCELRRKGQ